MNRRDMLLTTGAAALGLSAFPFRWAAAADKKQQKVLYYTRSDGFVHSVVKRNGNELAHSEKVLTELGKKAGFQVVCSQDETVFDGDLGQYDLIAFYTSGKALSDARKTKLLKAIDEGKPFVGFHAATDSFRSAGVDPPREQGEIIGAGLRLALGRHVVLVGEGQTHAFEQQAGGGIAGHDGGAGFAAV